MYHADSTIMDNVVAQVRRREFPATVERRASGSRSRNVMLLRIDALNRLGSGQLRAVSATSAVLPTIPSVRDRHVAGHAERMRRLGMNTRHHSGRLTMLGAVIGTASIVIASTPLTLQGDSKYPVSNSRNRRNPSTGSSGRPSRRPRARRRVSVRRQPLAQPQPRTRSRLPLPPAMLR